MEYILYLFPWIVLGFGACDAVDSERAFINWLMSDNTGWLTQIIMIAWPVFFVWIIANKKG